ncbi:TOMM precursor leader peptide-binding protein [Aquimarina sp. 2201CG5-10]|uniref:TOMM precursor leader peptide-binding protein n=1 Tax=Aquimarina callyspongiae TaxID=3098150 RepID=UPI002AB48846|nr:TOMM precursor leader peptide-binding protein [Aquimarina sp. 2201CG5-10]MDY8136453.1 TOMM precursor leader peptide-binding protein [Aquimarina sp. 2201CG5-10]
MYNNLYRIKEKYAKTRINNQYTVLSSESESIVFNDQETIELLDFIDQNPVSKDQLIAQYPTKKSLSNLLITLHQLEKDGYITQSTSPFSNEQNAFWEELGFDPLKLSTVLSQKSIAIKTIGQASSDKFKSACIETGLQLSSNPYLTIILTTSYTAPELEAINQEAIKNQKTWVLVKLSGITPYVGPIFVPQKDDTACYTCLQHRLSLFNQENKLYQKLTLSQNQLHKPLINHPLTEQLSTTSAIMEIIKWLYDENSNTLENNLISIDIKNGQRTINSIVKRPQCSSCGDDSILLQHPKPIDIQQEPNTNLKLDGGYRTISPAITLSQYEHLISPITGIVRHLKSYYPVKDAPIYNFTSGRNLALQSTSLFWLNHHLRSGNGGKGKTAIQAKVGALCEGIERYCMVFPGKTHTIKSSFQKLKNAIHPNTCLLFSKQQYENRFNINSQCTKFHTLIPLYLSEDKEIDWTPVYNLTDQSFKYLPANYCYAQYPSEDEKNLYAYPDSNGCASGNTIEEAILQGFLELVERDAAAIWWYNCIERPSVNLHNTSNSYLDTIVTYYKEINRSLTVLDITTDFNIPVFVAISHCPDANSKDKIIYAFGAHLDSKIALERAVIELNQLLPIVHHNKGKYLTKDQNFIDWLDTATMDKHPYLSPNTETPKNILSDYPKLCESTIYDSIQYGISQAQKLGLEMLIVNLTQPDIKMPVVKVIIPGLRHFWRRTAPGRLYDVPVQLGWISKKNTENNLNQHSIFI